ncbi:sensor domain-containing phosphodiesterase [Exiguobacterium sp. s142]|uniref:sensor domain-containing phosphodiesterase n=1 Tax=Exiguobacterium sp. s142 TaxID=2751222 RepID=UPI001BE8532F|nr:sensor domain-containing phosphodiesterase [Exiguobacterium sp. s142]
MIEGNFSTQTYRKHQEKLFELVRMPDVSDATVEQAISYMCEVVADMLEVDTVSIWHFDETQHSISCQVAYSKDKGISKPALTVYRQDAPVYFDALCTNRVLLFENVRTHEWVKNLYQQYFVEGQRVYSMLDAPIFADGQARGVICCETYELRKWTYVEELIVSTLADFVAILYSRLERQSVEQHIARLAYTDELTGLMNKNAFIERVDRMRDELDHRLGSLIYVRIDEFRSVEDALGSEKANQLIQEIANRLQLVVDPAMLARSSQSGFVVWTPYGDRIKAYGIADMLCETVTNEPFTVDELDVVLTMSAFISIEDKTRSTLEMIHTTRIAASHHHVQRGGIIFYEEKMGEKATARLTLEMNLRKGLALNEFALYYQPKIDGSTGQLNGFEGLMRWIHPEKGLIPPLDFIPLAESTGVIIALEEWALEEACRQLNAWHASGRTYHLALNLSARHFLSEGVVEKFARVVERMGVCPNYLTFEITESVGMENQQHVIERFIAFRKQGFSISIDDFGTGFSAFVYLKHYPIHEIKIDRQFIQATENDPTGNVIVQSIIELARGLGLKTVCEGIETTEQHDALRLLGCDEMQGYYFSRPLAIDELEVWIEAYNNENKDSLR